MGNKTGLVIFAFLLMSGPNLTWADSVVGNYSVNTDDTPSAPATHLLPPTPGPTKKYAVVKHKIKVNPTPTHIIPGKVDAEIEENPPAPASLTANLYHPAPFNYSDSVTHITPPIDNAAGGESGSAVMGLNSTTDEQNSNTSEPGAESVTHITPPIDNSAAGESGSAVLGLRNSIGGQNDNVPLMSAESVTHITPPKQ